MVQHINFFANNPDSPDEVALCKEDGPYQHELGSYKENGPAHQFFSLQTPDEVAFCKEDVPVQQPCCKWPCLVGLWRVQYNNIFANNPDNCKEDQIILIGRSLAKKHHFMQMKRGDGVFLQIIRVILIGLQRGRYRITIFKQMIQISNS